MEPELEPRSRPKTGRLRNPDVEIQSIVSTCSQQDSIENLKSSEQKRHFHQFQIYLLKIGKVTNMLYIKAKKLSDKYTQGLICSAT